VTRDRSAGELAPGFLDPAEEVEHPAGEEHRGCRIVRRQRAVGEVVLITGVEEQLGVVDGRDDSRVASTSPSPTKCPRHVLILQSLCGFES
jgi:hypothetical protein